MSTDKDLEFLIQKLVAYCRANDWAGYDPYDAVNSKIFSVLPFLNSRLPRLALTQSLKRSPVNLRRLLFIPQTQNPKALALFLSAFVQLLRLGTSSWGDLAEWMIERLIALRSPGISYWAWGYSFPWQTRTIVVPAGSPNLVCTAFVANALLDAYEQSQDKRCLEMAASTAEYVLDKLYWTEGDSVASFSYPLPNLRNQVANANLLGAALLCRVWKHTGAIKFLSPAMKVARYAAARQDIDGSWYYGEGRSQRWIDNFHTGYNLCALHAINRYTETSEFEGQIRRGLKFYRDHFFREDGAPRYFHNRDYPVDIHCVAQSIITLTLLKEFAADNVPVARAVLDWALNHMWDERGFFYYRVLRFYTIRTSYMRWSQAWMLLAISHLLSETRVAAQDSEARESAVLAQVS